MYESKLKYAEMLKFIPDKIYLSLIYFMKTRKIMHWKKPVTLNEKLQWLKVYNRNPEDTNLVDKYKVKQIISEKIGEKYIIPTLGVWDNANDIEWDKLPDKFVLRCTHDSHSVVICRDKAKLDQDKVILFLNSCLKRNLYWLAREWPYKNVKPRVIAEKFIENNKGGDLVDYKFYCYGGEPQYFMYSVGEASHNPVNHKIGMNLKSIDYLFKGKPTIPFSDVCLPNNIDEMISIVKKLCADKKHVRVDLFNVDGKIYFGEMTFFSGAGFINMDSAEYSNYLASLIKVASDEED